MSALTPARGQFACTATTADGVRRAYLNRHIQVLSELHHRVEYPDGSGDLGPQWHLSVSCRDGDELRRPSNDEMRVVLDAWGWDEFEEDNHEPGRARHLWCPVDPSRRVECECKLDEPRMSMLDGSEWSLVRDGGCAGCAIEAIHGQPCQVHSLIGHTIEVHA